MEWAAPERHRNVPEWVVEETQKEEEPAADQFIRIGMDTSKNVFQQHGVNAAEQPALRKTMRRKEMEVFFARCPPTVIAIEACGASHHWARLLKGLGS